jgi:hypothetical protein
MSDKSSDPSALKILDEINNTPISKKDIIKVVQGISELEPEERDFTGHTLVGIRLFAGEPEKVKSIMFRLEALARLMEQAEATGWSVSLPNGAELTQEPMFAAAAVHPLILVDGQFSFDCDSFLEKVLELADLEQVG